MDRERQRESAVAIHIALPGLTHHHYAAMNPHPCAQRRRCSKLGDSFGNFHPRAYGARRVPSWIDWVVSAGALLPLNSAMALRIFLRCPRPMPSS